MINTGLPVISACMTSICKYMTLQAQMVRGATIALTLNYATTCNADGAQIIPSQVTLAQHFGIMKTILSRRAMSHAVAIIYTRLIVKKGTHLR